MNLNRIVGIVLAVGFFSSSMASAESMEVGLGSAKFNGLLQTWTVYDTTATAQLNQRLRRAEIKFSGDIAPNWRWSVMIDPAKSLSTGAISSSNDNKILQDFVIGWAFHDGFELVVGQFKTPTAAEGLISSGNLILPERSITARTWGDKREPGAMVTYKISNYKFYFGGSHGQATNVNDDNRQKDLHLRAEGKFLEHFQLGFFTSMGDSEWVDRARWGSNLVVDWNKWHLDAEIILGRNGSQPNTTGWYSTLAYQINECWQPVTRYEEVKMLGNKGKQWTLGMNHFIAGTNVKAQFAYTYLHNLIGNVGSPTTILPDMKGSVYTLGLSLAI